MTRPVDRAVRAWARLLTAGLPPGEAAARRGEIASDLWEHRAAVGAGRRADVAVASRWLRGVPADLAWRFGHAPGRRAGRPDAPALVARGLAAAGGILLAFFPASAVVVAAAEGWPADALDMVAMILSALIALGAGCLVRGRSMRVRRVGAAVLGGSLWTVAGIMAFAWPVLLPAALAASAGLASAVRA